MSVYSRPKYPISSFLLILLCVLTGCHSGENQYDKVGTLPGGLAGSGLTLNESVRPQVSWNDTNGKTQVILQFSVRDGNGIPLQDNEYEVVMMVNDKPVDVESLLNQSSDDLEVNLYFAMVLDASYSMTQHTPPAFEPMKAEARNSYQEILDLWNTRPGEVKFSLLWFDELMNQSQYNISTALDWSPGDILSIPEPVTGTATKLYSAVNVMTNHLQSEFDKGIFAGARDQYIMLVFSDGADNYSYWPNSTISNDLSTTSGASYHQFGTETVTLDTTLQALATHPRLTTHVLGLGSDPIIKSDVLSQIAAAGHGKFVANPSSKNIAQLFETVMREFTTIQTRGAEIPLPPGEYDFTLVVKSKLSNDEARSSFRFKAGDYNAGVVTAP